MKIHTSKILDRLSVVLSAVSLSAILALLVLLIVIFPAISNASAIEGDSFIQEQLISNPKVCNQPSFAAGNAYTAGAASISAANTASTVKQKNFAAQIFTSAAGQNEDTMYGLIGENVILYDSDMQPITGLPATYFVIILGEDETHYHVSYRDLTGYAEKLRIFKIDYEPRLKFGLAHFTAQNDTHPVIIREKPTSTSRQQTVLPHHEKTLYYGSVTGEALIPAAGNLWYYVNFEGHYGYVYSAQGSVEPFAVNPGDKVLPPASNTPPATTEGDGFPDWAFILLLSVPAVIIMLALFGRGKTKPHDTQKI